jgi:hypothetical protein
MATKKAAKATAKKSASKKLIPSKHPLSPFHPLYGRPILDAIRTGNLAQMRQIRGVAQKHVTEVNAALAKLEARLKKG